MMFAFYRLILLSVCMNIEQNPGLSQSDINSLDIFHLSTRSIHYKIDYIKDLADSYHILCFSETHLDAPVDSSSFLFPGFASPIRKDRSQNVGGVMIYVSSF